MRNTYLFLLLVFFLSFCSEPEKIGKTIITAENIDIPSSSTVYLTTMEERAAVLDSAKVSDGSFQFSFADDVNPFRAYIAYRNKDGKLSMVYFKNNDPDSANSNTYSEFFIVERGTTRLKGKESAVKQYVYASIVDGEENELVFNPGYELLGNVDNGSKGRYELSIQSVKKNVEDYPKSFLLMERVYENRGNYRKQDLEYILSKLKGKVRESAYAYNLGIYLKDLPDDYDPFVAFPLLNKKGVFVTDYDRKKKLNMLIITATWSHASNLLLFYMNRERQSFDSEDLYIADIGADEIEGWWWDIKGSVNNDFIWDELNVPIPRRSIFLRLHDLPGFPLVIFTDQNGKEVKRFWHEEYNKGSHYKYNGEYLEEIKTFIREYLGEESV